MSNRGGQELNTAVSSARPQGGHMGGMGGRGKMAGGRAKNFKKSIGKLFKYLKPHYIAMIFMFIFAVLGSVMFIMGPKRISDMGDIIMDSFPKFENGVLTNPGGPVDLTAIGNLALLLIILYSVGAISSYLQGFIMSGVTQKVSKRLRTDISNKINKIPLKYFDSHPYGDTLSRVTNDVDTIGNTLTQGLPAASVVMFFGSLLMMFILNWIMALTAIVAAIIGFMIMGIIMKRSQKYFVGIQKTLGALNAHIEEVYSGHNVVKAYNAEAESKAEFERLNNEQYENAWKSQFFSGLMMPVMNFMSNFSYVAVCVAGGILVFNGLTTFPVIIAFMIYIRQFTNPLSQIAQAATMLQGAAAASERVFEFLAEPEMEDESGKVKELASVRGDVEFEHVEFGYDPEKIIIKDFSVKIKAGQKVAIVGPTGAGKTTLVNLLMRFYELNGGSIKIDGVPTTELTRDNVHRLFGMVLQDTWLFEGTIKENIIYGKKDVTDEQAEQACRAVGLDHFIKTLPKSYDAKLDDKASLSSGQKQLLTIARAIVENAPMIILDEATSSVDTRTEALIQRAMDKLTEGRTSFVIAHRLSTIRNADIILVMRGGDIVESGSHNELLKKDGFYADLYNSQFEQV